MRGALLAIAAVMVIGPSLHAQDGLRSASLPERPIASAPPGPDDLFRVSPDHWRARPDTYRPHPNRPPRDSHVVVGTPWWPFVNPAPLDHTDRPPAQPASERDEPSRSYLQLRIEPADATVYVNGYYKGNAVDLRDPGAMLPPGSHRVEIRAEGYETRTFDIRLSNGETLTYRQSLAREVPAGPPPARATAPVKTLYVIPGCYAGDKPPSTPTRCDLTQLRTIR